MADAYQNLAQGTLPSVAASFASPSAAGATSWLIKGGPGSVITNIDTVQRTFQLWIGGTADTNTIGAGTAAKPITLGASESYRMDAGEILALGPSDALYGVASVSGKLVYNFGGDKVT